MLPTRSRRFVLRLSHDPLNLMLIPGSCGLENELSPGSFRLQVEFGFTNYDDSVGASLLRSL